MSQSVWIVEYKKPRSKRWLPESGHYESKRKALAWIIEIDIPGVTFPRRVMRYRRVEKDKEPSHE